MKSNRHPFGIACLACLALSALAARALADEPPLAVSGRYPHLAMFNSSGECGTGAVVPWADRLWVITYAPHLPNGSDDKLYEIDTALHRVTRPESVGGTPADRMIHAESNQLVIGPYFIDAQRNVRVIPPQQMPGRLTAAARHLTDPAAKVYVLDMEGMLYEVDVKSLAVTKLAARVAPGAHLKGGYTAQGRLVVANNGNAIVNRAKPALDDPAYAKDPEAAGVLAQWDGHEWSTVERRQFTDVTGPGGINGSPDERSPLWAVGWDKRSVILKLLDGGQWSTYRLPIADYSYAAKHGWYTEWPRIREVGDGHLLMNMHGGWFEFPRTFSGANTGGIRPLGTHLKITADFAPWQRDQIVFGCDDASLLENPWLGQSQSNLWFTTWAGLSNAGRPAGSGGPWVNDRVKAGEPSVPYLLGGYAQRVLHLTVDSDEPVTFAIETDASGRGAWGAYQSVTVPAHGYAYHVIPPAAPGEWVRLKADRDCTATAYFNYGRGGGVAADEKLFAALAPAGSGSLLGGAVRPLGGGAGTLWFEAKGSGGGPVEFGADLHAKPYAGAAITEPASTGTAKDLRVTTDEASVLLTEGRARYRLPIGAPGEAAGRAIREVVTERAVLNAGGSFFVLPRITAGGAMRLKPICTHGKAIADYCSWRGLLVLSGTRADAKPDGHYFGEGRAGLWFGDVDDLWRLGKPVGKGGPWLRTAVTKDEPSDPYLMAGYDRKSVHLTHDASSVVRMTVEVDYLASGHFHPFKTFDVPPGDGLRYEFPAGYSAHWVRVKCDAPCAATAQFTYD